MHSLRFGILTLQTTHWQELVRRWRQVEAWGFDHVWVADHFVDYGNPTHHWLEAWTLLAGLAALTKHIRVGTLVTNATWRNPAMLARMALTADHVSQGRLELGLGSGSPPQVDSSYSMLGLPEWSGKERVARFHEVVEILDQLLTNKVSSYQGRFYTLNQVAMVPPPVQKPRPPLTLAALGPMMLQITAKHADTWNTYGGRGLTADQVFQKTKERSEMLDHYCEQISRPKDEIRRSLLVYPTILRDPFESRRGFLDLIQKYRQIGFSEFIFYYPTNLQMPVFERVVAEDIPRLCAERK
jgi:alkanesulfonate monooxygenase SsuD/methylene tetrahydromethanopterin reductase-like flavin-dependent oxidoreductase (luciferase family)